MVLVTQVPRSEYHLRVEIHVVQTMRDELIAWSDLSASIAEVVSDGHGFAHGSQLYLTRALSRRAASLTLILGDYEEGLLPF